MRARTKRMRMSIVAVAGLFLLIASATVPTQRLNYRLVDSRTRINHSQSYQATVPRTIIATSFERALQAEQYDRYVVIQDHVHYVHRMALIAWWHRHNHNLAVTRMKRWRRYEYRLAIVRRYSYRLSIVRHAARLAALRKARQRAQAAAQQAAAAAPAPPTPTNGGADQLYSLPSYVQQTFACIRYHESTNNYSWGLVSASGARGAYQFEPGTWAEGASWAGISPYNYSPTAQDDVAAAVWRHEGFSPWAGDGCV